MPPTARLAGALLLGAALAALAAVPASAVTTNGRLQIIHLDVGQGDGTVIITPQGQVVLIDFMGSNCSTCIREMRDGTLQAIYGAYAARGLEMISIDIGGPLGTENELQAWQFLKGQSPHGTWEPGGWIIALDNQGLAPAYLVSGIPLKYLIDRSGRIAMKWPGTVAYSDLSTAIEATLG